MASPRAFYSPGVSRSCSEMSGIVAVVMPVVPGWVSSGIIDRSFRPFFNRLTGHVRPLTLQYEALIVSRNPSLMLVQLKPLTEQLNRVKDMPIPEFGSLQAWEARASAAGRAVNGDSGSNDPSKNSQGYGGTPMPFLGETKVEVAFSGVDGSDDVKSESTRTSLKVLPPWMIKQGMNLTKEQRGEVKQESKADGSSAQPALSDDKKSTVENGDKKNIQEEYLKAYYAALYKKQQEEEAAKKQELSNTPATSLSDYSNRQVGMKVKRDDNEGGDDIDWEEAPIAGNTTENYKVNDLNVEAEEFGCTLNARLLELTDVLSNRKIDLACIQETRWKGACARECIEYKLWYSGVDNARNGVGYYRSGSGECPFSVRSTRWPRGGEKRCFWDSLDDVLRSIPDDQGVFIGGDFNGHIGSAIDGYDGVHGGFGFGNRNEEGRTLLEFATAHDMVVTNSVFNKRDVNLIKFHSGGHCTQIDYILVRNRDRWTCIDCKVLPEEACASQHRLLVLVFRVRHGRNTHKRTKLGNPKILWKNLHGATADDFKSKVLSHTGFGTTNSNNADMLWKNMANSIREVGKNTLGLSTGRVKEHKESWWWNDEVQTKVKTKQICFKEFLQYNDDEERLRAKQRYKEAKREAKNTVAKAKDKAYEEMYKRLDTKEGQNDIFRLAKSRENRKKDLGSIRFIKDNNGVLLVKDHDIKRGWGNYFLGLFNDGASPCRENTIDGSADHHTTANDFPTSRIEIEEVKMALRKMGRDKAVGPDQIPITVWLALGEDGVKWLTNIFNIILETAKMPEEWRESTVIPIYKNKGDPQRCGNYRGIKLLSYTMKLWERVIEARMRQITRISENQFGFMPDRRMIAFPAIRYGRPWKRDRSQQLISGRFVICTVDLLHTSRLQLATPRLFSVEIGLHQGSALSPYIFALIMDDIFCVTPDGVPWCMLFADDIVLVAETKTELNSRLTSWKIALEEKGLRINIEKIEYLCSNFSGNQNDEDLEVCIEGHVLPTRDCFKYLGSMIHKDGGIDDDVTHRIKAGWLKWRAATGVLCDKKVPLKLKGNFYRMAIRPALLYGSECWAIKKDHVRMMEAAEMRMLRWTCERGRLRWFGHVLRRQTSDTVRRVESITLDGAIKRGRPRRKWVDCLRSDLKELALTEDMTSDRKVWRLKTRVVE
ncbi:General transcription factor IIE subunit 1 isoform 3 [Hibiscus syriacus]|uniref:General transcription factor IIE subunit 1 isoform 3 n=1 Tax=Hibiscus syriacus TaxID=106335 RepID=A0A6A2YCZ4_HIBSY|nr:General transcription factor IIE subunit 1 isoform 3 [Hibiscus syriacus]